MANHPMIGSLRRRMRIAALATVTVGLIGLLGCGGGESSAADQTLPKVEARPTTTTTTTTTSPPTTTATTPADPNAKIEAEVRAAYDEWRTGMRELFVDPDPNDPAVDDLYAAGSLRDGVRENLRRSAGKGRTAVLNSDTTSQWNIEAIDIRSPQEVAVDDCYVDGAETVSTTTGEVLDDSVVSHRTRLIFVTDGGRWRVGEAEPLSRTPGGLECDAGS